MSMQDQTVVISGGTDGIGRCAAEQLAKSGARVIVTGRSVEKAQQVVDDINRWSVNQASYVTLDLSSPTSVRRAAQEILEQCQQINILINCAGIIAHTRQETPESYELTWATNHLGPFLLTNLLCDRIIDSAPGRIVIVSSAAQMTGHINFDDLQSTGDYTTMKVYAQSKLANVMFARSLAGRLKHSGVTVNSLHPGFVATRIFRELDGIVRIFVSIGVRLFASSPDVAARTVVNLASSSEVAGVTGEYFNKFKVSRPSADALDEEACEQLWQLSKNAVGL